MDDFLGSHLSEYHKNKEREKAIENLEKAKAIKRKVVFMKQGQTFQNWREKVKSNTYTKEESNPNRVRQIDLKIFVREYDTQKKGKRYQLQKSITRNVGGKRVNKTFSATYGSREEAEANIPTMQEEIRAYIRGLQ